MDYKFLKKYNEINYINYDIALINHNYEKGYITDNEMVDDIERLLGMQNFWLNYY